MSLVCVAGAGPMKLHSTEGPDAGSLTVVFRCPECEFRVAMLTNPFETQMVKSLGVQVGGRTTPAAPFEHLRSSMTNTDPHAFKDSTEAATGGPGCPFDSMVNEGTRPVLVHWIPKADI